MAGSPDISACKTLITELLPTCYPTVEHTATLLGMPVRTLQRRLYEHGQSYSQLVDAVRLEHARRLLREPGTRVNQVATALGYADPSSFSRAFRRWTGMAPRGYQRRRQQARHRVECKRTTKPLANDGRNDTGRS